jgi:alkylation response protein AidB-like acyl-CoA dehydrogenase
LNTGIDFEPDETQQALAGLADEVLTDHGGHVRAREVELEDGLDRKAWESLGDTGLLAAVGSGEGGIVGAAGIASLIGRHVVTVPAWALLTSLSVPGVLNDDVLSGHELVTIGLHENGIPDAGTPATRVTADGTLIGSKPLVPALLESRVAFVSATGTDGPGLYAVDLEGPGVTRRVLRVTDRGAAGHLVLSGAPARFVGDGALLARTEQIATVLTCATLIGLGRAATQGAASYITERQQFGRAIASFQAPVLRLADAHIDLEAMQVTMLQAAWQLDEGRDARSSVAVAKWWAAQGGHRVLHTAQHVHGGIGADIEFPAHRYFLRGKQLIDTLGGAAVQAQRLGAVLAEQAKEAQA